MKKNVWIDVTHVLSSPTQNQTGIGHFTDQLIRSTVSQPNPYDFTLVGNLFLGNPIDPIITETPQAQHKLFRLFPGKVFNQLTKKRLLPPINLMYQGNPDLAVFMNYVRLPLLPRTRSMTAVHDLTFVVYPEYVQDKNLAFMRRFVPSSIKKSNHILTISEATKDDLVNHYQVDPKKISVVYPGVQIESFAGATLSDAQRQKYQLPKNFFLYLGTLEPRKNIVGIIEAYSQLRPDMQKKYALVLAGGKGWNNQAILRAIADYDGPGALITPGYIDEEDIASLYAGAELFLFPSHYEGFGIPILQAMAAGTPVITADNSSLPEVAGDAALIVSSKNSHQISAAIESIVTDAGLRRRLIQKGRARVKQFTWEHSAIQFIAAIQLALSGTK
jgi:glycosyltransferase involved in cell wall biosynthesis